MNLTHLFASKRSFHSQPYKTSLALIMAVCLLYSSLFLINSPAQAVPRQHGCAPDTPPPVSGNPIQPSPQAGIIFINEALSNPASNWNCSVPSTDVSADSNSWIELYNPHSQPLDLYSVHTEISIDNGTNWYHFPVGTDIASNGFLVLFPEKYLSHASSWNVILNMGATLIDSIQVPALGSDQSYARVSDGSQTWSITDQPTINAPNAVSLSTPTSPPSTPPPTPTLAARPTATPGRDRRATPPANTGTQPAWSQLQLPPATTPGTETPTLPSSPSTMNQSLPVTSNVAPNASLDSGYIVLFTTLLLLFCGALAWCWRLFRAP